jgi:hypothetical protein
MEHPMHDLRDRLVAARRQALERLAAANPQAFLSAEGISAVRSVGELHVALLAVRDELEMHAPREGYGSEQPVD